MKKNIQINLFGTLYNIDDDAYNLLEQYLDSMRRYFSHQDGGEEIADDIEHRVAELLWNKKQQGMEAVDIDTIKEIIAQIGNPQDIDEGTSKQEENISDAEYVEAVETPVEGEKTSSKKSAPRRLYRNPKDKVIGGVCSGLAEYFGKFDVVVWRISFAVLACVMAPITDYLDLFMGALFVPFVYLLLCIIVPQAQTPEDRLRMKGDEVTPENINKEIINDTDANGTTTKVTHGSNGAGCLKVLALIILSFCLLPVLGLMAALLCGFIVIVLGLVVSDSIFLHFFSDGLGMSSQYFSSYGWLIATGLVTAVIVIVIPCYLIIKRLFGGRFKSGSLVTLLVVWFLSLVWTLLTIIICGTGKKYINHNLDYNNPNDSTAYMPQDTIGSFGELIDSVAIDVRSNDDFDTEE